MKQKNEYSELNETTGGVPHFRFSDVPEYINTTMVTFADNTAILPVALTVNGAKT